MFSFNTKHLKIFILPLGVLFLDQIFKSFFLERSLTQKNQGALFGIEINPFHTIGIFLIFTLFILLYKKKIMPPALLMTAGIISNLIDRIKFGYIIDYIIIPDFFAFNLADLAISLGAGFIFWQIIKE